MTINYCDFINGDDSTGDGTFGNPYKTITTASTGLTGGDEVRCAKSPDDIDLSGTLAFVDDSDSIATSVDLTGSLSNMDFIYKTSEPDNVCEITSLTSTIITLETTYRGTTETVSAKKLSVTDTGTASSPSHQVQVVNSSGTSDLSRLKISGGWNLSTQVQDGKTFFEQTDINLYGIGLYISTKSYLEVEDLGFLRYYTGFNLASSNYNIINTPICNNNTTGIYLNNAHENIIKTTICNSNTDYGIRIYGINNTVETIISNSNSIYGIYLDRSFNTVVFSPTCNNNVTYNIYSNLGREDIVNKYAGIGNDVGIFTDTIDPDYKILKMQHFQTEGDNRCYFQYGITYRDTVEAKTTQCLRYEAVSDTYYIQQIFCFPALDGVAKNISFYIKDDAAFNGDVQAALFFMGINITDWSTIPTTTSYVQQILTAQASDITEDGVIELKIKVRGTAGNVYIDDFEVS